MSYSKDFTLEELGKGLNGYVEVTVDYDWDDAEPQTWEHPGDPGGCEMTSWHVTMYANNDVVLRRDDRPDWFEWLDGVVERIMLDDEDSHNEAICEGHVADEPDYDDYNPYFEDWVNG